MNVKFGNRALTAARPKREKEIFLFKNAQLQNWVCYSQTVWLWFFFFKRNHRFKQKIRPKQAMKTNLSQITKKF